MQDATSYSENDTEDDADGCHGSCNHYTPGDVQSGAAGLLDDTGWLDFDRSPLISPSVPPCELPHTRLLVTPTTIKQEDHFLAHDESDFSLPELTDDDMSALVGSQSSYTSACTSPQTPLDTPNSTSFISPASYPTSPTIQLSAPPKVLPTPAHASARPAPVPLSVREKDIPNMVDLFNSMHSPSEATRSTGAGATATSPAVTTTASPTLSIRVPAPPTHAMSFPTTAFAPPPTAPSAAPPNAPSASSSANVNQFDYFTPLGYPVNGRYAGGNANQLSASVFADAALSPAAKSMGLPSDVVSTPQSRAAYAQVQGYAAAAAAAVVMASSAAAIATMRKLNTTYGVPIAPLQRSLHPELKPKIPHATTAAGAKALVASKGTTKISITPDLSDFKLVQIFHHFCDPATKLINLPRFHQLLVFHQGKDDSHTGGPAKATSSSTAKPLVISQETQRLFKVLDPKGTGFLDVERFMSSFQICNRCTEAKRRAQSAGQSHPVMSTAVERQLMEDVAPVLVRVVPASFEGSKVKSCEHYQWTWCEGFEKTGNEKCRGTNRHDKCPKYLANCTLWKHKLPPKNRKAKVPEHLESPSKKLKHFA